MQKKALLAGLFLMILILSVLFFLSISNVEDSPDSCLPPPTSIFRLVNKDINQSHSVSVIINDPSNNTLAKESYNLAPYGSTKSTFVITSETSTTTNPYYLIFNVDDNISSEIAVNVSYHSIPEFHIDPVNGEVSLYIYLLNGDYGCKVE
ncbi:hypothetical protein Mpet_0384 [Methanolacinia petrolearia DSM 11571]|uniref:Uncharacterized protein n=1 Tax=Methanolacinia petrolearia (strain DSM 11571 / OCM 486 / SEBR 4847) TaxID=679926 RepID=E1RGE7_METP4|nr:hypothetical protein [Methanolacinia petrolearia]ADN35158.1 hypothetical protein Mpet_0384 [Methanolacinia petrolearia DSM 11571]